MTLYRRRPPVIDAMQLTEETRADQSGWPAWLVAAWALPRNSLGAVAPFTVGATTGPLRVVVDVAGVPTPQRVDLFDWLALVNGETAAIGRAQFQAQYEPIPDEPRRTHFRQDVRP